MLQHHQISLPHENAGSLSLYQWQNEVSERPVLHWAHANGFNGRTYDPLLSPLAAQFDVMLGTRAGMASALLRPSQRK